MNGFMKALGKPQDQRPKRHGWAPGQYSGKCHGAGCASKPEDDRYFVGDKRAWICADCAYALPDELPRPPVPPSVEDTLRAEIASLKDRIEEAQQRAAETQDSWKHRCHAIMGALGLDYGDPDWVMPDEKRKLDARIAELEDELDEAKHLPWPEWAEKIWKKLEEYGCEAESDNTVDLPQQFEEWIEGFVGNTEIKSAQAMEEAVLILSAWLTDNTEKVFEEEPEIDHVRSQLQDALDGKWKPLVSGS